MVKNGSVHVRHEGHEVHIPYCEFTGARDGPHLFVSGGMHGSEVNGIAVAERFLDWCRRADVERKLAGRITVLPVLSPTGFARMERRVPEDNVDPNRAFGMDPPATFTERCAADLCEQVFQHCDMGVDVHDAGGHSVLLPHSRVHKDEASGCTHAMGQLFGTDVVVEREGRPHMMAIHLNRAYGIPVLTAEIGGAQTLYTDFIDRAVSGIRNILVAREMYPGEIRVPDRQFLLQDRFGVTVEMAARIELNVQLGARVHDGDVLGSLYYPQTQEHTDIVAPMCGLVFSRWTLDQAPARQNIFSILETDECHVPRTTTRLFSELDGFQLKHIKM